LAKAVTRWEFPPLFAEWNDHFRDAARRFWLEQSLSPGNLPGVLPHPAICSVAKGVCPASVNLVTAHDGFTLRDCVSFNHKHNEANGEKIATVLTITTVIIMV
jgi:glycogen operon protein